MSQKPLDCDLHSETVWVGSDGGGASAPRVKCGAERLAVRSDFGLCLWVLVSQ